MGKVSDVSPRRRNVRCPKCRELLSEPESPIYQCPFCFILLQAKGVPPDFQGESWQMPRTEDNQGIESSQQRNELEAKSKDGTEVIGSLGHVQLNDHEINEHVSTDGNIRQQEHVLKEDGGLVVENEREQELQLKNDYRNKSTGGNGVSADDPSQISTADAEKGMRVVHGEREGASMSNSNASPETHLLLDQTIQQLPSKDAENYAMPSAGEEKKEFSGECDLSGEGDEENFQSEIIRDNVCELSFKYISSAFKSNDQLVSRKRSSRLSNLSSEGSPRLCEPLDAHLTETRSFSSHERSDDSESYSSASESVSNESVDSEFDFPSPSGQSIPPPNCSDELVPQKMPLPDAGCDAPPNLHQLEWQDDDHENAENDLQNLIGAPSTPHQLEWQDVDHKSEEIPLQSSNGAVTSSDEVDAKTASDVLNGVDTKTASDVLNGVDQMERTEVKRHLQNNSLNNKTVLVGPDDTAAIVRECFHVQGGNADLIGDLENTEGSVISKESDNAKVETDCNGCQRSLVYELNKRKAMATIVPNSLDLLLPGAELLSKSNSGASLEEGTTNAGMFVSGTEDPLRSSSDGSDFETCLAAQKNNELAHSVVNVKLEDSIATISSKSVIFTGKASQANVDPRMICTEEIQERSLDPLHPQQNTPLSDAYSECRRVSIQGELSAAKRDLKSDYAAQNMESDSVGVQSLPLPLVMEPGDSCSHNAVNVSESRLYYSRNYPSETTQWGGREDTVNIVDSRPHNRRPSLEETRMQSELSNKFTSHVQKKMPSEGVNMSRSRTIPEESSNMHQRRAEVAHEPEDGQGPWLQKQNHQADIHMMQNSRNYSGASNGSTPGNFPPFGSPYYANGSDSFAMGVPNASLGFAYQAPSYSWMLPPVMPGFHYGCHSAAPVCMTCIHCQHSHMPQLPMPPCGGLCFNQPLPLAHQQGHLGWCNHHQAHQVKGPDQKASADFSSPPCFPPQMVHLHDIAEARRKPPVSLATKLKHYPPLPQSNTAPYIICKGCDEILEVPKDIPLFYTAVQKVRCGACKKVAKFSVRKDNQGTHNAVLESATTNKVSVSMSHAAQYNKPSRPPAVPNLVQNMSHAAQYNKPSRPPAVPNLVQNVDSYQGTSSGLDSQYKQGSFDSQQSSVSMSRTAQYSKLSRPPAVPNVLQNTDSYQGTSSGLHSQYKQGSFGSQQQISAASKRRGSLSYDEVVPPTKCELDTSDQDEFFFRSLSRYSEIDSSRIFFNGFKAASSATEASNFEGMLVGNVMDEKEEGLDFGAPTMSDGESLDQRSPESRMRSPENKQHFHLLDQGRHTKDPLKGEEYTDEAALDLKRKMIAEGKKPSASLFMLLNEQSSKFDIYRDKRVSFDESQSALFSTALSPPMDDDRRSERWYYAGDCGTSRTGEVSSSKRVGGTEPKSVVGRLRRSLKHFSRGH